MRSRERVALRYVPVVSAIDVDVERHIARRLRRATSLFGWKRNRECRVGDGITCHDMIKNDKGPQTKKRKRGKER